MDEFNLRRELGLVIHLIFLVIACLILLTLANDSTELVIVFWGFGATQIALCWELDDFIEEYKNGGNTG